MSNNSLPEYTKNVFLVLQKQVRIGPDAEKR